MVSYLSLLRPANDTNVAAVAGWTHAFRAPTLATSIELDTVTKNMQDIAVQLDNINKQSSCKKLASSHLLNNCASFDGNNPNELRSTEHVLGDFQTVYAVRMTACEMNEARAPMPNTCLPLLDIDRPEQALLYKEDCLHALQNDGTNKWTTYQAQKTNSLLLCRAMRVEKDKDEALHLHKILTSAVGGVNEAVTQQKSKLDEMSNAFHDLRTTVSQAQKDLMADIEVRREESRQAAESQKRDHEAISKEMHDFLARLKIVQENAQAMSTDVQETGAQMSSRMSEQLLRAVEHWQEAVATAGDRAAFQHQQQLEKHFNQIYSLTGDVALANQLINSMSDKVILMNQHLDAPIEKIAQINQQHNDLFEQQQRHFKETKAYTNQTVESFRHIKEDVEQMKISIGPLAAIARSFVATACAFAAWFCLTALLAFRAFYFLGHLPAAGIAIFAGLGKLTFMCRNLIDANVLQLLPPLSWTAQVHSLLLSRFLLITPISLTIHRAI